MHQRKWPGRSFRRNDMGSNARLEYRVTAEGEKFPPTSSLDHVLHSQPVEASLRNILDTAVFASSSATSCDISKSAKPIPNLSNGPEPQTNSSPTLAGTANDSPHQGLFSKFVTQVNSMFLCRMLLHSGSIYRHSTRPTASLSLGAFDDSSSAGAS